MSQLWWNPKMLGFFFTDQAAKTLEQLLDRAEDDGETVLDQIENWAVASDIDADTLGDMFHDETVEELAEEIGIALEDEEEGEGDD